MRGISSSLFYFRFGWFQMRDRFTDLASTFAYLLLYPMFVWLLLKVWEKFNSYQGHYTRKEVFVYLAITELLFMTFLRSAFINRASSDFSMTLSRPRSWLMLTFVGQFFSTLAGRLIYILTAVALFAAMGFEARFIADSFSRLLFLLPILGVLEAIMASFLLSAQLLWHETRYFVLPILKIFLALGGVFGPLVDYGEPWREWLLQLPASDMFFQVGHFCVKGEFYRLSPFEWTTRILVWTAFFSVANRMFFEFARKRHQSWGG